MLRLLVCELAIYGAPCSCRAHSTSLIGIGISAAQIRVRDVNTPVCKKADEMNCSYEGVCGPTLIYNVRYCKIAVKDKFPYPTLSDCLKYFRRNVDVLIFLSIPHAIVTKGKSSCCTIHHLGNAHNSATYNSNEKRIKPMKHPARAV